MKQLDDYRPQPTGDQNWGLMIGAGIVALGTLVMVINLSIYETRPNPAPTALYVAYPYWFQVGRGVALVASLALGGWLLWRLFNRQPASDPTYLTLYLQRAVEYIWKIEALLKTNPNGHEQQLLTQIYAWWQMIEAMTQVLTDLDQNTHMIQTDLSHLPNIITDLEQQISQETDPLLQTDLEQMLRQRQSQQQALEQLQTTRRRAEIQIERTISVLGTIYSQLLTCRSTFHVFDYQELADNVADELLHLQDYLEALHEVKGSRTLH